MPGLSDPVGASADSANTCSYVIIRAPFGPTLLKPVRMCAQRKGIIGRIQEQLEPSVPGTTIVNDGSIFAVLGLWCALASELQSQLQQTPGRLHVLLPSVQHALECVCGPVRLALFSMGSLLLVGRCSTHITNLSPASSRVLPWVQGGVAVAGGGPHAAAGRGGRVLGVALLRQAPQAQPGGPFLGRLARVGRAGVHAARPAVRLRGALGQPFASSLIKSPLSRGQAPHATGWKRLGEVPLSPMAGMAGSRLRSWLWTVDTRAVLARVHCVTR